MTPAAPNSGLDTGPEPSATPTTAASGAPLDRKRLFTAFLLTPMLAGFYPAMFLGEPTILPLGLVLAYVSATVFGIPLIILFDRRRVRDWWLFMIGGVVCALPTVILYAFAPTPEHLDPFGWVPLLQVVLWGASSGLLFWMVGVAGDTPVNVTTLFDPLRPPK
jgi:hypothetical protein